MSSCFKVMHVAYGIKLLAHGHKIYICVRVAGVAVVQPVQWHEGHLSRKPQPVHGGQDPGACLICVHHMVEQPAALRRIRAAPDRGNYAAKFVILP